MVALPDKFRARSSDQFNYAMSTMYQPRIHLLLGFEGAIDRDRMARALRLCLDAEPVLGCRFVPRWIRPYWKRIDKGILDGTRTLTEAGNESDFLGEDLNEQQGPQLTAAVVPGDSGDRLILKVNHQVADAGATKELAYLLASLYRRLESEPGYRPEPNLGSRSLRQVFRRFLPRRFFGLLGKYFRELHGNFKPKNILSYPSGTQKQGKPVFVFRHLAPERLLAARAEVASVGATINDLMITAMIRALARQLAWKGEEDGILRLSGTVDLRRYLEGGRGESLCNLSSFFFPDFGPSLEDRFESTLVCVKAEIDKLKKDYMGLGFLFGSYLATFCLPFAWMKAVTRKLFAGLVRSGNFPPALTNMGVIDDGMLDFGSPRVESAVLTVPANQPPVVVSGLSGFRDSITLSMGFYESALPKEKVEELFQLVDEELPGR